MNVYQWILKHRLQLIGGIGLGLSLFFLLGYLIAPRLIYDQFIWKYFWGPIVSDAVGYDVSYHGIIAAEKFTIVSEIIYGLLVASALFGMYSLFHRWNVKLNNSFFYALLPYVIFGSIARVLEDAHFFKEPYIYWFITPLIYFQILFLFLLFLILGHYLSPVINRKRVKEPVFIFIGGFSLLLLSLYFMIQEIGQLQQMVGSAVRFDIVAVAFSLVGGVCLLVYLVAFSFRGKEIFQPYRNSLNLAMLAGHLLDGFTSWISIYDPFNMDIVGYYEKHPASNLIMEIWPPLFPIVKFLLIIGVIYVFDILYKDDLKQYRSLIILLKIGIFILGFAPGLRDLLRVMMGV
jgi:uncharacterized membrane protein